MNQHPSLQFSHKTVRPLIMSGASKGRSLAQLCKSIPHLGLSYLFIFGMGAGIFWSSSSLAMSAQNLVQCFKTMPKERSSTCQLAIEHFWKNAPAINSAAKEVGIEPALLHALIAVESNYNASALSNKGARGLTQVMPGTSPEVGVHPDYLWNNRGAAMAGARYLANQWVVFKDWRLALAAYNAGPGAVRQYQGIPPYRETQEYVNNVLWVYSQMKAAGI